MADLGNQRDLNLEATELRLGLPGTTNYLVLGTNSKVETLRKNSKRSLPDMNEEATTASRGGNSNEPEAKKDCNEIAPSTKSQVIGWPPIRNYRKNCLQAKKSESESNGFYVKVSMDGAPYLRKIDLKVYKAYPELLKALEDMFKFKVGEYSEREGYNRSEFVPTYEDKDGDWMLVGDVPWNMFISSCKRLRIMKGSEARGLGCAV